MIEGLFIAIEGVDGAGTTTHVGLAAQRLAARGLPVHRTREPTDGPIGVLIRQMLTGRVVVPGMGGGRPPGWPTMALLFAADRVDHLEAEVVPNLMDGVTVITDRYDYSSVAYQSVTSDTPNKTAEWVRQLNSRARRPDLTIVLDVTAEQAAGRRDERPGKRELYETDELQEKLVAFYSDISRYFPDDNIVHIDGGGSIEETAALVEAAIKKVRGES